MQEVIDLGYPITTAVSALWAQRKIHRDIKPGNIMRRDADRAFILLDMGLVFDLDDESLSISPVGTKIYFAPEQMDFANRRSVLDFRSDLFSLGIVMYEMGTGHHPFMTPDVRNSMDVLYNIRNLTPVSPSQYRPEIPQPLETFIMRLLAKRPALRYRKVDMVLQALEQMKGGR
jgi:serine/threonine-protein kinase